jgi:D-glycero-D-manno-heptose 1,7-bisphosphate phosphatase
MAVIVASNQPAAAKGIATVDALDAVHDRVVELLGDAASVVDEWRYCRHHPDALDPALRGCECRKPRPGMLLDAAGAHGLDLARSWMVGDADRDVEAGRTAGCRTALVENPESAHRRTGAAGEDVRVADLAAAVSEILDRGRVDAG